MLQLEERRHLIDSLRPPPHYTLDCAIGTTFSLDLLALLTVPLAFTLFDWETDDGRHEIEPMAILEALERFADRIHIFCQKGQIAVPRSSQLLYSHLEDSIIEVQASKPNGVFHPKVWIIKYIAQERPIIYRLICATRNLTFDRSWDTALVLDGQLFERTNAFSTNHPLGDFILSLPEMANGPLPDRIAKDIDRVQYEIRRVKFNTPDRFDEIFFWPLGIKGAHPWPFSGRKDKMLVVSPFVSAGCLSRLHQGLPECTLISRLESLDMIPPANLANFKRIYFMNPAANIEENGTDDDSDTSNSLDGLHAKIYIADNGWNSSVWTGSANATDAAYHSNIEFLVELRGKRSRYGVDALLTQVKGKSSFLDLFSEYTVSDQLNPADPLKQQIEQLRDDMWRTLVNAGLSARILPPNGELFNIEIFTKDSKSLNIPADVAVKCWPITLQKSGASTSLIESGVVVRFNNLSLEAITSFYAFEIVVEKADQRASRRFVLNLPLSGVPDDRRERILYSILRNKDHFVRWLLYVLAEGGFAANEALRQMREHTSQTLSLGASVLTLPLFEALVKALGSNPEKIDRISRIVNNLKNTPEGRKLLPEGFDEIWTPIWAARQRKTL